MDGRMVLRILAALVLVAVIAGIGLLAFNAGVATQVQLPASSSGQPVHPFYGWGYWQPWPFFGFGLGCFGPLLALFLVFLALRAFTFLFWGPRWGHWGHMRHAWRHGWDDESGVPPMFREWHDRAHGQSSGTEDTNKS